MADSPTVQDLEAQGKYSEAIDQLRLGLGGVEPTTDASYYYNVGTLYLKNKDLGRAAAYLEKASLLNPDDAQIRAQHQAASSQWIKQMGNDRIDPGQAIPNLVSELPGFPVLFGLLTALLLVWAFRSIRFLRTNRLSNYFRSNLGIQSLFLTLLVGITLGMTQLSLSEGLFVLKEPTEIRSGPEASFMTLDRIPPGIKLRVVREEIRGEAHWYQIRYGSGQIGWVPSTSGLLLAPASTTQKSR